MYLDASVPFSTLAFEIVEPADAHTHVIEPAEGGVLTAKAAPSLWHHLKESRLKY